MQMYSVVFQAPTPCASVAESAALSPPQPPSAPAPTTQRQPFAGASKSGHFVSSLAVVPVRCLRAVDTVESKSGHCSSFATVSAALFAFVDAFALPPDSD
uniref:Uncharacterized protein n=1 Tax=Prymnesium polylepis TaxID=72548 RepID=A0A7S4IKV6_9EUKA